MDKNAGKGGQGAIPPALWALVVSSIFPPYGSLDAAPCALNVSSEIWCVGWGRGCKGLCVRILLQFRTDAALRGFAAARSRRSALRLKCFVWHLGGGGGDSVLGQ